MADLKLSRDLALPIDVAGEAIAILAKRGAGKTNTATVLAEELYAADVQTVVLDPVGVWWGLRSSADGEKAGLKVAVIGGAHGDVPLEASAGKLIADVAVDSGQSLVVDISDFPSKASMQGFVLEFAQRLYSRKGRDQSVLHLILEEADVFAPEGGSKSGDAGKMQAAIEQIVRRGRSRGLGVTLITQRSAVLSKDVLTQTDVLIVMRTTGPHDIKAMGLWVNAKGDERGAEVLASLPSLATGEAWVWNPEHDLLKRTKVRARRTFDSSRTPKVGERRIEPRKVAEIDPAALGKEIAKTAERAKANDPRALRRRVAQLEHELAVMAKAPDAVETIEVEKPAISEHDLKVIRNTVNDALGLMDDLKAFREYLGECVAPIVAGLEAVNQQGKADDGTHTRGDRRAAESRAAPAAPARPAPAQARPAPARDRQPAPARDRPEPDEAFDGSPSGPQQRVLDSLAWWEEIGIAPASRLQVAAVASYHERTKSFTNALGALNSAGLVHYPTPGMVELTESGRALARPPQSAPSAEELRELVYDQVRGPRAKILRVLVDRDQEPISREELAEQLGYHERTKSFTNALGSLRSLGFVEYPSPGWVAAAPILFLEAAAAA